MAFLEDKQRKMLKLQAVRKSLKFRIERKKTSNSTTLFFTNQHAIVS
jgi:hypothetical protein